MDFRGLDLNLLILLDALSRDCNQSRVAKTLGVSQPTISASLSKLRKVFKDDLIVKSGGVYRPTPRLLSLGPRLHDILDILNTEVGNQAEFDPTSETRPFVLATSDVGEVMLLPGLIEKIKARAPAIPIRSLVVKPSELEAALGDGDVDLAVGYFPDLVQSTIVQQTLFKHGFGCLVRRDHPTIHDSLSLKQFLECDHIVVSHEGRSQEVFENNLKRLGLKRRAAVQIPHFMSVPFLVSSTDLLVTVPKIIGIRFAAQNLKMFDPPMVTPQIEVKQFWHRRFSGNARLAWLRGLMMELFRTDQFDK